MQYSVTVEYTMTGTVIVNARTPEEAGRLAKKAARENTKNILSPTVDCEALDAIDENDEETDLI